ncbi:MAG: TonB family protein [Patescibacteria group bacterium]|nr:TonB family protein [Patescibacteria group bacterium]
MTDVLVLNPNVFGFHELRRFYKKYLLSAFLIAVFLHLTMIGVYFLVEYLTEEEEPVIFIRLTTYTDLGPPPSLIETEAMPAVAVSALTAKPSLGIPVPVPDVDVSPEQTIATQQELSAIQSPVLQQQQMEGGEIKIEQDIFVEEEPPDFVPVEKQPVPVNRVMPEYPEIARRAGVEGTVWVKMLVGKDGKVRKAVVQKSDAEIFNEAAIKAALQWVFTPAMMNNGPVAVWASVPLRFKLNK